MRVRHVTYSDEAGGADISALRIANATSRLGVHTSVLVADQRTNDPLVEPLQYRGGPSAAYLRGRVGSWSLWLQNSRNPAHRSINLVPSGALAQIEREADIVHLHWVGRDTLSIAEIGRINHPVIWNLHDGWPFLGAEHHPEDPTDIRYETGYARSNRSSTSSRFDLDRWVWRRKRKHFSRPIHLVAPSEYMRRQATRSLIANSWPIHTIPNPIDTHIFSPGDKASARHALDIARETKVIAVAGDDGGIEGSKGWDLLISALRRMNPEVRDVMILLFGTTAGAPLLNELQQLPFPVRSLGRLNEDVPTVYRAADVVVVPSRIESFSQVAAEAQSCGTPVVAFATSGLLDVVSAGQTGSLVAPFDSQELTTEIATLLVDEERRKAYGHEAVKRAQSLWSYDVVGNAFVELYAEVASRKV